MHYIVAILSHQMIEVEYAWHDFLGKMYKLMCFKQQNFQINQKMKCCHEVQSPCPDLHLENILKVSLSACISG